MPIHAPGQKFRHSRILSRKKGKRDVVALLSLTAMVDMFTVLVIFLLQNYNTKDFLINTPENIVLPQAAVIKELKPAVVVTVTADSIMLDEKVVANYPEVKNKEQWMIPQLYNEMVAALAVSKKKMDEGALKKVREAVRPGEEDVADPNAWRKVTIQADRQMDFLSLKKIMFTITEAGAGEINFAVVKEVEEQKL